MPHVLICDDHTLFLEGLVTILQEFGFDCECVSHEKDCLARLKAKKFDIFLCDINIAGLSGFEMLKNLSAELNDCRVFMLSGFDEDYLVEKARSMQLAGYLRKDLSVQSLVEVLSQETAHFVYIPREKTGDTALSTSPEKQPKAFQLSRQEKRIVQLLTDGYSSKEIAEQLFISKNTVDTHRRNINRKLGVNSLGALIKFARENHLLA